MSDLQRKSRDVDEWSDENPRVEDEATRDVYASPQEFVDDLLSPLFERLAATGPGARWRERWQANVEAQGRLDALWRAWEDLRLDGGTGMSVWFRDHLDPHMAVLLDARGPFGSAPRLYYPNLGEFVTEFLAPLYRRPLEGNAVTWCAEWWRHGEAVARLEALWRAWEQLRLDGGTGMSVWFRDHLDPHMAVLLDTQGPFKGCKPDKHGERLAPLPVEPPPDGMFTAGLEQQVGEARADLGH